jgi:2,5-diketo-D-gluconate reductase A
MTIPSLRLNSGDAIPQIGFGGWLPDKTSSEKQAIFESALAAGYRHIDTASGYDTEKEVGAAVRASGIPRDELFITTKVLNGDQKNDTVEEGYQRSLDVLDVGHIDLYLIHWPMPKVGRYVDTYQRMLEHQASGLVKAVGVSNFDEPLLRELIDATGVTPAVNQIEWHPLHQQRALVEFHRNAGIVTEAWGPLGHGRFSGQVDAVIAKIAAAHGKTPVQVILRWAIEQGVVTLPKANSRARQDENLAIFDFTLTEAEVAAIDALDDPAYAGTSPDEVND